MAGAGYKLFNTGDVLTAAQVNTYLQEQTVMVFANAAARTTALTSVLAEGMMSYLQDTNSVEVYNGSAWVSVGSTGDITEVTTAANSGLTGGATSGAVALRVNTSAKGSIIAGTGATTLGELTVGANNTILTADSSTATGLKWATAASAVNPNHIINGSFAIAQRGTSFTSTGGANNDDAYTVDRWYILSDGNDIIDVTQETTNVPTNGQFAIALDVETINKKFGIATILENRECLKLIGGTVTFSFQARVSSTTKLDNVKAAIVAWSGTSDSVTSDIISTWNVEGTNPTLIANATYENTPANLNLTTSYATYSVSAAVDTASAKNIILFIWSDVTDTTLGDFIYISQAKLEIGSTATAFRYYGDSFAGEIEGARRFYLRIPYDTDNSGFPLIGMGQASSTSNVFVGRPFDVAMRAKPSSLTYSNLKIWNADTDANVTLTSLNIGDTTRTEAMLYAGGSVTDSITYWLTGNASTAANVAFNAEL